MRKTKADLPKLDWETNTETVKERKRREGKDDVFCCGWGVNGSGFIILFSRYLANKKIN